MHPDLLYRLRHGVAGPNRLPESPEPESPEPASESPEPEPPESGAPEPESSPSEPEPESPEPESPESESSDPETSEPEPPEPESESRDATWRYLEFAPQEDSTELVVDFDTYVQPAAQVGRDAALRVLVDDEPVGELSWTTTLLP